MTIGICYVCSKSAAVFLIDGVCYCKNHVPRKKRKLVRKITKNITDKDSTPKTIFEKCNYCGKLYEKPIKSNRKYCDENCRSLFHANDYEKIKKPSEYIIAKCLVCGKGFVKVEGSRKIFCSKECGEKYSVSTRIIPKLKICKECGKEFIGSKARLYCSEECSKKHISNNYKKGRFRILNRDNFRCFYCGKSSYKNDSELHLDHIIPRSIGGESIAGNLVTSCSDCNTQKNDSRLLNEQEILEEIRRRNIIAGIENSQVIGMS